MLTLLPFCFSAGGKHGSPEFTRYSYYYKGQAQPGASSNMALVSQAFIQHRQAARDSDEAIPKQLFDWGRHVIQAHSQLWELKNSVAT